MTSAASALYVDPSSNAVGLVLSNAIQFTIPWALSSATTVSVVRPSTTATSGTVAFSGSPAGLVIQFDGVFR
ncbi:MAG: hypothetical protein H6832_03050 [Planctomycetes bacterium]|nr:hypothetical protein [Planctomycetota bacterium]